MPTASGRRCPRPFARRPLPTQPAVPVATPPADACTSWHALYAGTRKLVDDVMQHIHLENNVLFPQFSGQHC